MLDKKAFQNILLATWLGWLFDGLDSSLYPLVARQALGEILGKDHPEFGFVAAKILSIFIIGWALGGYIFGYIGDRIGRVRALSISILTYALFTGFTGLASSIEQFTLFRFLTGLGIGGEWALGVALLAESVDPKRRIMSTAFLGTGFPIGYMLAAGVNYLVNPFGWRYVFFFGVLPAIVVFFIRKNVKEPKAWSSIKDRISSPFEIFKREYRKNLTIAFLLGVTFSLGAWGCVVFWFPIWIEQTLGGSLNDKTTATFILMFAHVIGSFLAGSLMLNFKRKFVLFWSYLISFIAYLCMYLFCVDYGALVLILCFIGGVAFGVIPSGFAIYFPELFPVRIRTTAKGFCYNTGRVVTAGGVLLSGYLVQKFSGDIGQAAAAMSLIFLLGAVISLFAPDEESLI